MQKEIKQAHLASFIMKVDDEWLQIESSVKTAEEMIEKLCCVMLYGK